MDKRELVDRLKLLVQERAGIPKCEQRLVVDASWQHATVVRVAPQLLVEVQEDIKGEIQVDGTPSGEVACTGKLVLYPLESMRASLGALGIAPRDQRFKYKVHPALSKQAWEEGLLAPRRPGDDWASVPSPLIKWQRKSSGQDLVPVALSYLRADGLASLELELKDPAIVLEDLHIQWPLGCEVSVVSADIGEASSHGTQLTWQIPQLSTSARRGRLELRAPTGSGPMRPVHLEAASRGRTTNPIEVLECSERETMEPVGFACERLQLYDFYFVVVN